MISWQPADLAFFVSTTERHAVQAVGTDYLNAGNLHLLLPLCMYPIGKLKSWLSATFLWSHGVLQRQDVFPSTFRLRMWEGILRLNDAVTSEEEYADGQDFILHVDYSIKSGIV